ncbi:uncharacterized protein MELLADRAFT_105981 [Melampsora larici-populina 98AG31]|uniref:Uncharacterized protein n=1 Tax=Melampsora larici-populina (strain 98AG31 / pathotype 3-4-7) TaxID=747676 RepID=F4RJZ2_MELLP|nr:uncharacterized protein MELLADRAFT_105981 [Melampsora larici-populina 98AG31]EGG07398.1 hypothetical protein MELLADRAFT_105981 [Melampsora larici-populina 98AG31]
MEYLPSPLSGDAYSPRYHKTFNTSIPEVIRQQIRTKCSKRSSARSYPDRKFRSLGKLLLARHPHLKYKLLKHGNCAGLGPSSTTVTLAPRVAGYHPVTMFSPQTRLVIERAKYVAPGLSSLLIPLEDLSPEKTTQIEELNPRIKRKIGKEFQEILGIEMTPLSNKTIFRLLIQFFRFWVQDHRCSTQSRDFIREYLHDSDVLSLMEEFDL